MPYGITQCYLPPGRSDIPAFTSAKLVVEEAGVGIEKDNLKNLQTHRPTKEKNELFANKQKLILSVLKILSINGTMCIVSITMQLEEAEFCEVNK